MSTRPLVRRGGGRTSAQRRQPAPSPSPSPSPSQGGQPAASRHGPIAQLLMASSPLSLILVAYAVGDWIDATIDVGRAGARDPGDQVNRLGLGLHVATTAGADRHAFGAVPSVWLQAHLFAGSAHWYDAVATLVYVTHFVGIPVVTAAVWFRLRDRYAAWIVAVVVFIVLGVAGYVGYPADPPWLASQQGVIGPVTRISGLGWHYLHLAPVEHWIGSSQAGSNPVAAMPSLHAGSSMLIALFLWPVVTSRWRATLLGYVGLMGVALVYTGEHYVVDVVAGWLTAAVAVAVGSVVRRGQAAHRRRSRRRGSRRSAEVP